LACVKSWRFPPTIGAYTLIGRSRAADGTAFVIPELGFAFDCGALIHHAHMKEVFISHTHHDHCCMLTFHKSRTTVPNIYVPAAAVQFVRNFLVTSQELTDMTPYPEPERQLQPAYTIKGCTPLDIHTIKRGGSNIEMVVIECFHKIDCVGYAFFDIRKRLRQDLVGTPKEELARLARSGENINEMTRIPLFAFLGDTTHEVFTRHGDLLFQLPIIIVECSFISDDEVANARRTKHMHWNELSVIVHEHPAITFILIHFSKRYTCDQIRSAIQTDKYPNVIPWLTPADEDADRDSTAASSDYGA